jgi:hypothetical protein
VLKDLKCPATSELACRLSGSDLFLLDSVSNDPQFSHPVQVPDGFPGYSLAVPHPTDGQLYVKLRDDPSVINPAAVPTQQLPPSADESAHAAPRHAALSSLAEPLPSTDAKRSLAASATENPPVPPIPPAPSTRAAPQPAQSQAAPAPNAQSSDAPK